MASLFDRLPPHARRGSKPRCHLLTHGDADVVAARLTELAHGFARVAASDHWMPQGFVNIEEAQLDKVAWLPEAIRTELSEWWLAPASRNAMTPNFDIASTCTVGEVKGLLLVEAKAHDCELLAEACGRRLRADSSDNRALSHEQIGNAIDCACAGLEDATHLPWGISRHQHYQMSNRFACAWKLTELGLPVVLVYLGFLNADEMVDRGKPLATPEEWESLVKAHSKGVVPEEAWGQSLRCKRGSLTALIQSLELPLDSRVVRSDVP